MKGHLRLYLAYVPEEGNEESENTEDVEEELNVEEVEILQY